jgi:oligoendopeptidase F
MERTTDIDRAWDLTHIYAGPEEWEAERVRLTERIPMFSRYRSRLGEHPRVLADAFDLMFELSATLERLHTYAALEADEDLRLPAPSGRRQRIEALMADMAAAGSWFDPELLDQPLERLHAFVEREPRLAPYRRYLERLENRRAHTLDHAGEHLLGLARLVHGDGSTIGEMLRNAEIPWRQVTLTDGTTALIDPSGYVRTRQHRNREVRQAVFHAFHGQLRAFRGTLAASLYATVKGHVFEARARRYASCLDAALGPNEVDPRVYEMLIHEVNAALPSLHRYLRLRARILGIPGLQYHDIYVPLVEESRADYSWEASRELVLASLAPLGERYVARLRTALSSRWVDVDPRPGKRSGGYVNDGAFRVHPYMLLNHQNDWHSASTLAHEAGHLMHSLYSQESCPYPTARYTIFVAEVASTFNESLLFRHALQRAADDSERLALLGNYLEGLRSTVFRQTMFAEFELKIHELVESGEALTGEVLDQTYALLLDRYHGTDQAVMGINPLYHSEWAHVPHFHYDFYVYQYATSFVAATALARQVSSRDCEATERYLRFLAAGSTKPPVELLKEAGVDMTSPQPIRATIDEMNDTMDEIESLLKRGYCA